MTKTLGLISTLLLVLTLPTPPAALARMDGPNCDEARKAVQAEIDAACPCEGPRAHADRVRCVTNKLRDLSACSPAADGKQRSCGPVPRQCAAKIRRIAARSACGKPTDTVTCCVPKQRDCAGDPAPGDGSKEGTCTSSTRKCDSVTECMVPKCELSATAERCAAVGGTVGAGRDCATACPE